MVKKKELKSKKFSGLPMTPKAVSERLQNFNNWRSGEDNRTMDEAGLKPRQITLDLEFAIKELAKLWAQEKETSQEIVSVDNFMIILAK